MRIVLSGIYIAVMLTYMLGDVLRIFAGDFEADSFIGAVKNPQTMWMLIAVIMMIPIVVVVLTLTVPFPTIRWLNIAAPILVILFNLARLPYKGMCDNFLIAGPYFLTP